MSGQSDPKETVRQEWTGAAPLWKKWYEKFAAQTREGTELMVREAGVSPGMQVLDLASGTGEPALSLARAVGPRGRVVATDLVPEMLAAAREHARGLSNMEFQVADAERLPFGDAEFDRVTCRFGLMFFPEVQRALAGVRRVLKPGGRVCFAVFASLEENPGFAITMGPFLKRAKLPPPRPDAPHVFRFADPAKLAGTLAAAGLKDTRATKHPIAWAWPGPPEEAWEATSELAAPFKKVIAALPPEQAKEAMGEVMAGLHRHYDGQRINLQATVIVGTGTA
jgi:SAM-dependent methyltransferase